MDWFRMMYEGNPRHPDPPEEKKYKGFALFLHTLLRKWWELIGLNVLFFFSCLFIVTIPAALTALTRICILLLRGESPDILREYWITFRGSFLRSLTAGGILAILLALTGYGAAAYAGAMAENGLLAAPFVILLVVFLVLLMSSVTLSQMLAFSDLPTQKLLQNAVLLTLAHPGRHLLVLVTLAGLTALYLLCYPYSTVALAAIALSAFWLFASNTLWPVTQEHVFSEG